MPGPEPLKAMVFNIERCSGEDGPGIRTVAFLKGCGLRCQWCANPESQNGKPEILHKGTACADCGRCREHCPKSLIRRTPDGWIAGDGRECSLCRSCVDACYYGARVLLGEEYTVEELWRETAKDIAYYRQSGGGVTFSGGEPLLQADFVAEFGRRCRESGITLWIETCGQVPGSELAKAAAVADGIYYDFKHVDPERHRELTGVDNLLIVDNLRWLNANYQGMLSVRYPYVPGKNDSAEAVEGFVAFAAELKNAREICFLPYHRLGLDKYRGLGRKYALAGTEPLNKGDLAHLLRHQKRLAIPIRI
ncbi:MAG: glycyl-radical enzyme activating protein [Planctomycetota bacterium]|jgi:pyruvate formate lyase activating enzyme|nr:glycyl-radical enzyme activating protein [Planctomycetota bacterium]